MKHCKTGFGDPAFSVKNRSILFQSDAIRVTGTVNIDPRHKRSPYSPSLEEWIEAVNEKSIWQTMYGPNQYDVESKGKKYAIQTVEMC